MKDFIEEIVKQIVSKPEAVIVEENISEGFTEVKLTVDAEDMGIIIGKEGKTIKSLRSLVRAKAIRDGIRANLELVEVEKLHTNDV